MQQKKDPINKVTVSIFDEEYVVRGEENTEYIQMLAAYVDRRMRMIQQRNPNLSNHRIAILTALNLADELNKLQEDYDQLIRTMASLCCCKRSSDSPPLMCRLRE
jgi:cell division protein ZapA